MTADRPATGPEPEWGDDPTDGMMRVERRATGEDAAPRTEAGHDYDPACGCRDCHLEAEAEDATWD